MCICCDADKTATLEVLPVVAEAFVGDSAAILCDDNCPLVFDNDTVGGKLVCCFVGEW